MLLKAKYQRTNITACQDWGSELTGNTKDTIFYKIRIWRNMLWLLKNFLFSTVWPSISASFYHGSLENILPKKFATRNLLSRLQPSSVLTLYWKRGASLDTLLNSSLSKTADSLPLSLILTQMTSTTLMTTNLTSSADWITIFQIFTNK